MPYLLVLHITGPESYKKIRHILIILYLYFKISYTGEEVNIYDT